ncbi:C-type lectin lectoxin-Thr1-like [Diadema antillarum]|uniref:C-type lectin lectoxin-Thr1-like n=1 Tax=Diadema antillarum TaxID=105358 RepID=UPI003A889EA2
MTKSLCVVVAILASFFHCVVACCPTYYTEFDSKCYRVFGENKSWYDAATTCGYDGADLVSIHSPLENNFVFSYWHSSNGNKGNGFWIGLNDISSEGSFKWDGGWTFNYANWRNGEPNNRNDEDCVKVYNDDGRWNDEDCHQEKTFVCKRGMI